MGELSVDMWIQVLVLGGLAGALGQSLRVVVGLKKANDTAHAEGKELNDLLEPSKLVISLIIGFTAGALSAIVTEADVAKLAAEKVLAFAAAGYAGADFIEGFMSRVLPGAAPAKAPLAGGSEEAVG